MYKDIRRLFLSGRALNNRRDAGKRTTLLARLSCGLPYFFFLNAVICVVTIQSPFCFFIALVFAAWGATNLLFRHCHRCRDALLLQRARETRRA